MCGDQGAALFAHGALPEKTAAINLGTGAFILMPGNAAQTEPASLLCGIGISSSVNCKYLLEGTVNGAGAALSWAQQQWPVEDLYEKLDEWLGEIQSPPLFINTVGGLGSPWWKGAGSPYFIAQKQMTAARRYTAIIESIAFLLQHNIEQLQQMQMLSQLRVSGGLSRLNGLCQKLADLSGLEVVRFAETEATARGVAWMAAGYPEVWEMQQPERCFNPGKTPELKQRYKRFTTEIEGI